MSELDFRVTLLTADPVLATRADAAGFECVGVDIERLGKAERQSHIPGARISEHSLEDLRRMVPGLHRAAPFVRLNPPHPGQRQEIEAALEAGARVLMLPYFRATSEVETFVKTVAGRARIFLLIETAPAAVRLHDIIAVGGIEEIMIGMNDLHRDLGLANHFELLGSGWMDALAEQVHHAGLRFGFGGLGRALDQHLPMPSDLVYAQFARLRAGSAWLARSFLKNLDAPDRFESEFLRARERLAYWFGQNAEALTAAHRDLRRRAVELAAV